MRVLKVKPDLENYPTPPWVVERLLEACPLPGGTWFEPCAGSGSIIKAITRPDVRWNASEIREEPIAELRGIETVKRVDHVNFLDTGYVPEHANVVLTNPPFSQAADFLTKSLRSADHVVLLLRLSFLSSQGRYSLLKNNVPNVYVLPERPSFAHGTTDKWDYAWFHWDSRKSPNLSGRIVYLQRTDPNVVKHYREMGRKVEK
jgi:hypothetical protein